MCINRLEDQKVNSSYATPTDATRAEQDISSAKNKKKDAVSSFLHMVYWLIGIIFAFIPVVRCFFFLLFHPSNTDAYLIYEEFIRDFLQNGSVLWLSATLLVMSLADLWLYGYNKKYRIEFRILFTLGSIALAVFGITIYFDNIRDPMNQVVMNWISGISVILFLIISYFITFELVSKEN